MKRFDRSYATAPTRGGATSATSAYSPTTVSSRVPRSLLADAGSAFGREPPSMIADTCVHSFVASPKYCAYASRRSARRASVFCEEICCCVTAYVTSPPTSVPVNAPTTPMTAMRVSSDIGAAYARACQSYKERPGAGRVLHAVRLDVLDVSRLLLDAREPRAHVGVRLHVDAGLAREVGVAVDRDIGDPVAAASISSTG